jgi:DNA polymerase elongation subunit (family B)
MFDYRNELKKQGHSSNKAIKLILNSLYGKFAQTIGKAQYYSPVWAGLITANTRAQISRVISDDVVCTMTDSIWSRQPLQIQPSRELGEWESQDETRLILAEAGLYQAYQPDGSRFIWQRGFDKRTPVDIEGIVTKWLGDDPTYEGAYNVTRFIGMGLASITSYPWRHWIDLERKIQPVPLTGTTKRLPLYPLDPDEEPMQGFQQLSLRPADEEVCSYPYSKLTLDPALIVVRLTDECEEIETH